MIPPSRQFEPARRLQTRPIIPKRAEGDDSPPAEVVAAKAALEVAQKARNKAQERADMLGAQIFQLYGNLLTD